MASEAHASEGATGYIVHHLTSLSVGEGFWTLHIDTLFFSAFLGGLFILFFNLNILMSGLFVIGFLLI